MNLESMQSRKKHMTEDTLSVQFHLCDLPGEAKPMDGLKKLSGCLPTGDGTGMGSEGTSGACSLSGHGSAVVTPKIFTFHSILKKKHK